MEIESLADGVDLSEPLTRARFEELNNDLFKKTLGPVKRVRCRRWWLRPVTALFGRSLLPVQKAPPAPARLQTSCWCATSAAVPSSALDGPGQVPRFFQVHCCASGMHYEAAAPWHSLLLQAVEDAACVNHPHPLHTLLQRLCGQPWTCH